eukprot:6187061-Pleurochrysis_carterae.AAC.1
MEKLPHTGLWLSDCDQPQANRFVHVLRRHAWCDLGSCTLQRRLRESMFFYLGLSSYALLQQTLLGVPMHVVFCSVC